MGYLASMGLGLDPDRWSEISRSFPAVLLVVIIVLGLVPGSLTAPLTHNAGANTQGVDQQPLQQDPSPILEFPIPTPKAGPLGMTSDASGNFWFTEFQAGKIGEYTPSTNTFNEFQVPENNATPATITIDKQGVVWFTDEKNDSGSVWSFNPSAPAGSAFTRYPTPNPKSSPVFVLADGQNNIWFTEAATNKLGLLNHTGYAMTEYTLPTAYAEPLELSIQPGTSFLWITETNANRVARFDMTSHGFQEFTPSISLNAPVGIVADNGGNVWVAEHGGSSLVQFVPSTSTFKKFPTSLPPAGGASITSPATLAIDAQGRLWFMEHYANRVGRLDPSTAVIDEFAIPTQGRAYSLLNALDKNGNFWFTEFDANKLGTIASTTKSAVAINPPRGQIPQLDADQTVPAKFIITNNLTFQVQVSLNVSSSFTPTGQALPGEVILFPSIINLGPAENRNITVLITPGLLTASGLYSVGVAATYGNTTSVAIIFIQVRSFLNTTMSLLPELIAGVLAMVAAVFLLARRRTMRVSKSPRPTITDPPLAAGSLVAFVLFILSLGYAPHSAIFVAGKCPGLPPPQIYPNTPGTDPYTLYLEIATLGFFTVVGLLAIRSFMRKHKQGKKEL